jgi:hypothetical protein
VEGAAPVITGDELDLLYTDVEDDLRASVRDLLVLCLANNVTQV